MNPRAPPAAQMAASRRADTAGDGGMMAGTTNFCVYFFVFKKRSSFEMRGVNEDN